MSVQQKIENVFPVSEKGFPIVLRFKGMRPRNIWRFLMHDRRRGGDLLHIDPTVTHLNGVLFGEPDWDDRLKSEIRAARERNFAEKIRALEAKSRKKDATTVRGLGPSNPWNACREGPLREGIITVNKDWFGGAGIAKWDKGKVAEFKARAMDFLQENFPDGQLRYASGHADEEAFHIHFVVAVWREKVSKHSGRQVLLAARLKPGLELIKGIAAMAAGVVKKLLAVERKRLQEDLAFVSGLRAQLSEAQSERLSGIEDRHGFDKGIR